ncbi:MAG: hypothetical protein ACR2RF_03650 [Geminicoccaceae bacterium]
MPTEPTFEQIHAPGSRILTASRWPCLILPVEQRPKWLCSPYELGAHMLGLRAMPDPGDEVRRGKQLEAVALQMLEEELDEELEAGQTWVTHSRLPAGATLDGLFRSGAPAETKVVDGRDYDRDWASGPPLYPTLQLQCQIACKGADYGHVGALVLRHKTLEMVPIRIDRHSRIITALEIAAEVFMEALERGELPEPDASPSSYAAMLDLVTVKPTTIQVPGSEAMERASKWRQAQADKKAADAQIEAQRLWFAANASDAAVMELDDGSEIKRSQRTRKAHECKESTYWNWKV